MIEEFKATESLAFQTEKGRKCVDAQVMDAAAPQVEGEIIHSL